MEILNPLPGQLSSDTKRAPTLLEYFVQRYGSSDAVHLEVQKFVDAAEEMLDSNPPHVAVYTDGVLTGLKLRDGTVVRLANAPEVPDMQASSSVPVTGGQ